MDATTVNAPNLWRLETPGHAGWTRTARPGAARKYFIVSADEHVNEPATLWFDRIDKQYRERLPRVVTDEHGVQWRVTEGHRPDRLRLSDLEGEDLLARVETFRRKREPRRQHALRVEPQVFKVGSERRPDNRLHKASIWVTRTPRRTILRIRSQVLIGAVTLDLVRANRQLTPS
jgi:hypothetical protein